MGISDWVDMMPHTVSIEPFSSNDSYGEPSYGASVSYRGRITRKPHYVRGKDGNDIVAEGVVWLGPPTSDLTDDTVPTVTTRDRITLPDGTLTQPPIMSVSKIADENGDHHLKIHFGSNDG